MALTLGEQRAISKAMALDVAAQVERVRFGLYRVPSTSEAGGVWTVAVEDGAYSCTCKAASKPACVHRAAVYLAKVQAKGAKVVGVKPAARESLREAGSARQGQAAPPACRVLKPVDWLGVVSKAAEAKADALRAALVATVAPTAACQPARRDVRRVELL